MQYITSINNQKCLEWGINATQGALMAFLFKEAKTAEEEIIDGEVYSHIPKQKVIEELPIFFDKIDTVYRNLKLLHEKKLIKYVKKYRRDYIKIIKSGKEWISYEI